MNQPNPTDMMSESRSKSGETVGRAMRFDAPHLGLLPTDVADDEAGLEAVEVIAGKSLGADALGALELHAERIAQQLRHEQREIDAREAECNTRIAHLESELRAERLRHLEREAALVEREVAVEEQTRILTARAADLALAQRALPAEASPERTSTAEANYREMQALLEQWRERVRELDQQERLLKAQFADLASGHRELHDQKSHWLEKTRAQRQAIEQERQGLRLGLENRQKELEEQSRRLEYRDQAVQQMHADLSRLYREALELQLSTEQIWLELRETASEPQLTTRLAELRSKLSEEYRLSEQYLASQQIDCQERRKLARRDRDALEQQRGELREWFHQRQLELEQQTARLADRELEIERRAASLEFALTQAEEERRRLEGELRGLRRLVPAA